jgi:shikimate kinase
MTVSRTNIVLVGFIGSGKSSVGRLVAHRLGFQFVDTDAVIVERAGHEISEIFAHQGEDHFRDLETGAIASLSHLNRCVIATGGGAVLREENRKLLRELGFVVLLTASDEVIYERVARNNKRPLLRTENPRETVTTLLSTRRPAYEATAHTTIDSSELGHEKTAEAIVMAARAAFGW